MTEPTAAPAVLAPVEGVVPPRPPPPAAAGLAALAEMDSRTPLDMDALAHLLSRSVRSIERAVQRSELPAPFRLLGRRTWTAQTLLAHFQARQEQALVVEARRAAARQRAQP